MSDTPKLPADASALKGVCYMQRVPPFMSADQLRNMLEKRFKIGRIYLEAEPEHVTNTRRKTGGNRKTNYTEGWIEFVQKKDAKMAAIALNNQLIGGKKQHNKYRDDTWTLKYLKGFKWHHLTEKLAYDQKMRQQRLKSDVRRAEKEINFYQEKAELSYKIGRIEERRAAKDESEGSEDDGKKKRVKNMEKMMKYHQRKRRDFKQREPIISDLPTKRQQV